MRDIDSPGQTARAARKLERRQAKLAMRRPQIISGGDVGGGSTMVTS